MDHAEHLAAPAALAAALDAYEQWLDGHVAPGRADLGASGASLLHAVAEIRRHHCPGATQLMTNLLLDHTKLSSLLFEYQLKAIRGQAGSPLSKSAEFTTIVDRQHRTVTAMRSACVSRRSHCILTTPSVKGAARFPGRPAVPFASTRPSPI